MRPVDFAGGALAVILLLGAGPWYAALPGKRDAIRKALEGQEYGDA